MGKEKIDKTKAIINDLLFGDEEKALKAINEIKAEGDDNLILPLIELWNDTDSPKIEDAILELISDIKSTTSSEKVMEALTNPKFEKLHLPLLTTIWNSDVDYSEYLTDFVSIATQKDFMNTLECLTIIENLNGPFEEHHILDSQIILREYAEKHQNTKDVDPKKLQLLQEISEILIQFEENLD
ncbi:MAG: hypothetical protein WC994_04290 [Brumimicrobium sp.]